jgi:methyl-accepting chemotaxis protein
MMTTPRTPATPLATLSIRTRLLTGFGVLLLTGVFGAIAAFQIAALQDTLLRTQGKEALLGRAQSALWELRYGFPQFLVLTGADDRKKIIDAEPRLYAALEDDLKHYGEAIGLTDEEAAAHRELTDAFQKYKVRRAQWFQYVAEGRMEEATAWRAQYTTPLGAAAVKAFTRQIELTARSDIARRDAQQHAANRTFIVLAAMGAGTVLFGLAAAFYVYRSINRPLQRLQSAIDGVTAGDFTARTELTGGDELGRVGASFDRLLDDRVAGLAQAQAENDRLNDSVINVLQAVNLMSQRDLTARAPVTQDVIGTVSDSINALTDETSKVLRGVTDIAGQVREVSGKVKLQAELVSRTAHDERQSVNSMIESLGEATLSMKNVAALADLSNRSAEQVTQVTDTALETVNGTVKGMEAIRETIAETEKRIKRLGERSQEISGIVNLINTISERTHVLALNASMQAAVAGEAGRGFAVVAEEVQRLAESSRAASQQIGALVGNIQLETNETISTVNRTIGQVVHGSEQAQKAGEQMRRTQEITGQLVAQVRRIAESSEEQRTMSANLLQSVRDIGQSTERTAQQIVTQNQETETLLDSARRLVESVGVFKLPRVA